MSARKYIQQLDGLRSLAIFPVLLAHGLAGISGLGPFAWVGKFGSLGVQLFFVLSGYLITGILLDEKNERHYFRNFFVRRGLRVWPLYYLVLTVAFLSGAVHKLSINWFAYAAYFNNLVYGHRASIGLLGPTWSLAVEEQFYLVWPVIVRLLPAKALMRLSLFLVVATPILRLIAPLDGWNTLFQLDALGLGALLACGKTDLYRWRRMARFCLCLIPLGMAAQALPLLNPISKALQVYGCGALLVVVLDDTSFAASILKNALLVYIGRISYGIYLLHPWAFGLLRLSPLRHGMVDGHSALSGIAFVGIQILASIALASISFYLFEKHILRLKRYFHSEPGSSPTVSTRVPTLARQSELIGSSPMVAQSQAAE